MIIKIFLNMKSIKKSVIILIVVALIFLITLSNKRHILLVSLEKYYLYIFS